MKYILISLGTVLFILFAFPITLNVLNFANVSGMVLSLVIVLYGKFFSESNSYIKKAWKTRRGKALLSAFSAVLAIFLVLAISLSVLMFSAANNPSPEETTVVVLGCKVNPNGPSVMLTTRLEAAYTYLTENPDAVCILSGGQGTDEHISEAQAMYDWLTERGIDKNRLYIEDKSTSTRENLAFSKEIIDRNGLCGKITVITNEFHQYRAKKVAKALDIEPYSYSAKTPFYLFPTYYVRELFAILYEIVA